MSFDSDWITRSDKIGEFQTLQTGWDGYSAPPPNLLALNNAHNFVNVLSRLSLRPDRVKPSVVGGIGITFRRADHKVYRADSKVYVEFLNDGSAYVLKSDGKSEPKSWRVRQEFEGYHELVKLILE